MALVCYHYAKHRSKEKNIGSVTIKKTEKNNKLKIVSIKTCMRTYFNCIIQIEDFDFNNNLLVKKSYDCAKL